MISVINQHINQLGQRGACPCRLDAQILRRERFEIVVVDGGSTASSAAVMGRHPGVR
jgi:alkyl hydroperoxide reductase subunit AhpF